MPMLVKQLLKLVLLTLLCQGLRAFDGGAASPKNQQLGAFKIQASASELLGTIAAMRYEPILSIDDLIEWEVYVPPDYDPDNPAGLLVYVSPQDSGEIPSHWKDLMADFNLIWVAANDSGNKVSPRQRIAYSLLAVAMIARDYRVAQERVYLSGFSGGGRIASMVATQFPGLFKGAIYNCGVNFWEEGTPESVDLIKGNRFVFVTGSKDFNLRDTRRVYKKYENAGVHQIKLMVIPSMGHQNPKKGDYAKAIAFLDNIQELPKAETQ